MTDEEYARYSPWQQQMVAAEAALSKAPAELWLRPTSHGDIGTWYQSMLDPPGPDAVRYVRADLYVALRRRLDGLMEQMTVVRSWNEAPCREPLPPDAGSHEQQPSEAMLDALRALRDDNAAAAKLILGRALQAPCREPLGTDYPR